MTRVTLDQKINHDGQITTCSDLLDQGKAIVTKCDNFYSSHTASGTSTKYFVDLVDGSGGWEIGVKAYESRAAKGQDKAPVKLAVERPYTILAGEWDSDMLCYTLVSSYAEYRQMNIDPRYTVESADFDSKGDFVVCYTDSHDNDYDWQADQNTYPFDFQQQPFIQTVVIPAFEAHEGIYHRVVSLYWTCPVCGEPRGKVFLAWSWDGSRRLSCHGWVNPCGHIDKYSAVRSEAQTNGLNERK